MAMMMNEKDPRLFVIDETHDDEVALVLTVVNPCLLQSGDMKQQQS
jgi:hypothetical protein